MVATALQPAALGAETAVEQADKFIKDGETGADEKQSIDCELINKENAAQYGGIVSSRVLRFDGPTMSTPHTNVSGVMELGLAAGLACPKTRSVAARLAQAFLLGVWPGNIYMAIDWFGKKSPVAQLIALVRVPLQLPMIASVGKLARKR